MPGTTSIEPDFLTLPRAARRAGIDVKRLRRARDRGELAVFVVGKRWQRVAWEDVVHWLRAHRALITAPSPSDD